jgi:hypothetical protein
MTVLTIIDTVLLALALIYIVALLRSHADLLRRLAALEDARGRPAPSAPGLPAPPAAGARTGATTASAISGTTLAGDSVMLSFGPGSPVTLLAFLTSGCTSCAPLWAGLREAPELASLAERVVVVTHDSTRESPARVKRLAPTAAEVIMASGAWDDYGVPASPHFVLTDGSGGILGRGSALSWSQLMIMVADARDDSDAADADSADADSDHDDRDSDRPDSPDGLDGADGDRQDALAARTTAERARRSEQMLAQAGIGPGHPSLYPSGAPADDGAR